MHPENKHTSYDFKALTASHSALSAHVFINEHEKQTIDFSDSQAVFHLNKAILKHHYGLADWNLPENYLCPPIPGRADYIHHLSTLLNHGASKTLKGLDIGVGANCIYPILGAQIYGWQMTGCDIDLQAMEAALANVEATPALLKKITIIHQPDPGSIFKGIINPGEYYDFTMCNPPFHGSREEAEKGTSQKLKNLGDKKGFRLNFGGQSNELWCNGGEALFIKRMIKESVLFKNQVGIFTTLVSKKEHLSKIYKQLDKLKATHKTILMEQGNKQSRLIAWNWSGKFLN